MATVAPIATETPPEVTASPGPTAVPPEATTTPEPTAPSRPEDLIAQGELIFQKTAGGIGCQACHGTDATGLIGPDIRGRTFGQIGAALGLVDAMSFIMLTEDQMKAVAAYLQTLK